MRDEMSICSTKVLATEESAARRQSTWMRAFQNEMRSRNFGGTILSMLAPQHEDKMTTMFAQYADHCISELIPTKGFVRAG